ncbi:MAG: hypothetical protein FWC92_09030 [Defluviitaleaceae bacterium]|nr:hypothetical protein [Defluviitaleaceae bacterium]
MSSKKVVFFLCMAVVLIVLSGCKAQLDAGTNSSNELVHYDDNPLQFNFTAFTNQLEASPILDSAYKYDESQPSWLSVGSINIRINGELVAIYAYDSVEDAKRDAMFISPCGYFISRPDPAGDGHIFHWFSWETWPHWFMRDLIVVRYVGECDLIIGILKEILGDNFAGYGVS